MYLPPITYLKLDLILTLTFFSRLNCLYVFHCVKSIASTKESSSENIKDIWKKIIEFTQVSENKIY